MEVDNFVFSLLKNIDSSMKDTSDSASVLPWLWVIEALAGVKEVDTSTLLDLINIAPIQPDGFGKNSRELIALRCLEGLVEYAGGIDSNASSTLNLKVGFDYSQSCEDALLRILQEVPSANPRMAAAEVVKWDLHPFIVHKRATTIKCDIEKMKESILEGTLPHTDYIKKRSGLALVNTGYPVHMGDGKHISLSRKGNANCTYAESMGTKEISMSSCQGNGNQSCEDDLENKKLLPSKRSRIDSDDDNVTGYQHENQVGKIDCEEFLRNKKKTKCHLTSSNESIKEKPGSQDGRALLGNSSERVLLVSEGEGHPREKGKVETVGGGLVVERSLDCRSRNDVCHDQLGVINTDTVPSHTFQDLLYQHRVESLPTNVALPDEIRHLNSDNKPRSENGIDFQHKDLDFTQQKAFGDKAEDGNGCEAQISSNSYGYQNKMIDLTMKKHELLIPQCSSGHDSLAHTVLAGQNLGLKCDGGGQVLVSDTTTFPLVVSKSCLATSAIMMPQSKSGDEPLQITFSDKTKYDSQHRVEEISANVDVPDEVQHESRETQSRHEIGFQPKEANGQSSNGTEQPVAGDEAVTGADNGCGAEISSDGDDCHNEEIDLRAKKHLFLSFLCTPNRDFSASCEWTEQRLCIKCNKDGPLLVCKMTCPVVVHESCLPFKARFDDGGNFLCPFCAYSLAISEYFEAKKNASLARKELAIFTSAGHQATDLIEAFHGKDVPSKNSEHEYLHIRNNGTGQLQLTENNTQDHVSDHLNKADNNGFEKCQQQAKPSASCVNTVSSCREKESVSNGRQKDLCAGNEGERMVNSESSTVSTVQRLRENQAPADNVDIADKSSSEKSNVISANPISKREGSQRKLPRQTNNGRIKEPACADDTEGKEIPEGGTTPTYSLRQRKRKTQSKPQARFILRRKTIPWSSEEEEILREGVKKFANAANKGGNVIPWKEILAFGCGVFNQGRTAIDLKDKWRNMSGPKTKKSQK